jgi:hypothetical protein
VKVNRAEKCAACEPGPRVLDWTGVGPALVERVGEDPYHSVILGKMWPEELGPSAISLVRSPY